MRLLDTIRAKSRDRHEQDALRALANKLAQGGSKRESVIASAPLPALAAALLDFEGVFSSFSLPEHPTAAEIVQAENLLKQLLALFNQARKYKVGLIVAHQNLDQLKHELRASILASTAIKLVGGMSAWDATAFAKEMRCDREFLQGMHKHHDHTEFACFVRNVTPTPLRLRVPFGAMESRPRLTEAEHDELLDLSRARYAAGAADLAPTKLQGSAGDGFELGRPEVF